MHMLRVGKVRRVLVASPDYLSKRGEPARMSDLRGHDHITLEDDLRTIASASGKQLSRLRVNSVDAGVAAAVAGLGIVSALSYQVADHVAEGRLKVVLPDPTAPELPISLLFQGGRKDWPTIRAFIDVARQYLAGARLS
jgi:DNA-binding transcriptional LysR family regulator